MPAENTGPDSIRLHYSGAASHNGAQTSAAACLGNYRSSTRVPGLGASVASPISNVTISYVAPYNGTGTGTLTAASTSTLTWAAPSESAGAAVSIANGETKVLYSTTPSKCIIVSRTSTDNLTGAATLTLTNPYNAIFDNVASADATAGDDEYRGLFVVNGNSVDVLNLKAYLVTLGTQRVSGTAQLGASGGGTITVATGTFADWPTSGFCRIADSGTLREIVYYSSRTDTSLTVPAAGRAALGTTADAGSATDTLDAVPGIRIALATEAAATNTAIETLSDEDDAPTGVTWNTGITAGTGLDFGTLTAGYQKGLWIHRQTVAGASSLVSDLRHIRFTFDAA